MYLDNQNGMLEKMKQMRRDKMKYSDNDNVKFGGAESIYTRSEYYHLECCDKTTVVEVKVEPLINDKARVTLECPDCHKIHTIRIRNNVGEVSGNMKLVSVEDLD